MKRVATARKPPMVVPLVVVAVDVHVTLIVPAIEGELYGAPSCITILRLLSGLNRVQYL